MIFEQHLSDIERALASEAGRLEQEHAMEIVFHNVI